MARYEERDDSYDLLNQYLHEIAQVPRLTPERERELGKRVQENDKAALEELVKANLRFVVSYAKKYRNSHVLFLDLINEGNIGLIHAAKKFDPDKNVKFITYAVWWIRQSILHALSEQGGAFRLPPKRANLMYRLEKAIAAAMTDGKQIPTADELAAELGVSVKEVQTLLRANTRQLFAERGAGRRVAHRAGRHDRADLGSFRRGRRCRCRGGARSCWRTCRSCRRRSGSCSACATA